MLQPVLMVNYPAWLAQVPFRPRWWIDLKATPAFDYYLAPGRTESGMLISTWPIRRRRHSSEHAGRRQNLRPVQLPQLSSKAER